MSEAEATQDQLSALMAEFVAVKAKIKHYKDKSENLRTNIMLLLKVNDMENFADEDNMLKLSTSTRRSFDKDKAIEFITEKGGEADMFFSVSEFETLKIKPLGQSNIQEDN